MELPSYYFSYAVVQDYHKRVIRFSLSEPCIARPKFINSASMNTRLFFYATNTVEFTDKSEFMATAIYTANGIQLTSDGQRISQESDSSGLFPNRFRGMHGQYLRVGVVQVTGIPKVQFPIKQCR